MDAPFLAVAVPGVTVKPGVVLDEHLVIAR